MPDSLSVPRRFNGPLESGNGGYAAGLFSSLVDGVAQVSLRAPVPLDTPLVSVPEDDGAARVVDGDTTVAEVRPVDDVDVEVPAPVALDDARPASERYRGLDHGQFSRCFVCGRAREDAFGVFAGEVDGRDVVASPWTPPDWTADADGNVRPEFVWAVLDCPTFFASHIGEKLTMSVLAQLTARIDAPVRAGEEHVVTAWPVGTDGRKRYAGAAVLSADGRTLAVGRALMIEPRSG